MRDAALPATRAATLLSVADRCLDVAADAQCAVETVRELEATKLHPESQLSA